MIFCNTKSSCSFVHEQLKLEGIDHGSCPLVAAVSVGVAAVIVVVKPAVVSFALGFPLSPSPLSPHPDSERPYHSFYPRRPAQGGAFCPGQGWRCLRSVCFAEPFMR